MRLEGRVDALAPAVDNPLPKIPLEMATAAVESLGIGGTKSKRTSSGTRTAAVLSSSLWCPFGYLRALQYPRPGAKPKQVTVPQAGEGLQEDPAIRHQHEGIVDRAEALGSVSIHSIGLPQTWTMQGPGSAKERTDIRVMRRSRKLEGRDKSSMLMSILWTLRQIHWFNKRDRLVSEPQNAM
jgi:hypothetical protein